MTWYDKIHLEIVEIQGKGTCSYGHQKGDQFDYTNDRGKICPAAMNVLYPYILGLQSGGSFPWEKDPDSCTIGCPDHITTVVFKATRIKLD